MHGTTVQDMAKFNVGTASETNFRRLPGNTVGMFLSVMVGAINHRDELSVLDRMGRAILATHLATPLPKRLFFSEMWLPTVPN